MATPDGSAAAARQMSDKKYSFNFATAFENLPAALDQLHICPTRDAILSRHDVGSALFRSRAAAEARSMCACRLRSSLNFACANLMT
jgi:hypothetical protein